MAKIESNPGSDAWVRPAHQTRSREQRDRLLKAAERVFAKEGFAGAHVSQIAELAQCSVGSFYRRFKDKEALFFALQEDMAERAHDNIQKVFDNSDWLTRPLSEKFEEFIRNTARTVVRIEGYYRALFEMSLRGHQVWAPMRSLEDYQAQRIAETLAARKISTEREDFVRSTSSAIRMVNGVIISTVIHQSGQYEPDDPAFHRELAIVLLRYLGIEKETRGR